MVKKILLMLAVALSCGTFISWGQNTDKTVTLVVSGEGLTKEEATKNALRSAIEQAFGTFVSANTEVVNDELIKDEIVSVTTGNIQKYTEISYIDSNDNFKCITLEVVVSIDKLQSFAQSHGVSAELSGATFAMNVKLQKLNIQNEEIALNNLACQVEKMMDGCQIFDLNLVVKDPSYSTKNNNYSVEGYLNMIPNKNFFEINKFIRKTILALSLKNEEIEEFTKFGYRPSFIGGVRYNMFKYKIDNYHSLDIDGRNILTNKYASIIKENELSSALYKFDNDLDPNRSRQLSDYKQYYKPDQYRQFRAKLRADIERKVQNGRVSWEQVENYMSEEFGCRLDNNNIQYPYIYLRSKNYDAFIKIYKSFLRQTINFEIKNNLGDFVNLKYKEYVIPKESKFDLMKLHQCRPIIQNTKNEWIDFFADGSIKIYEYYRCFAYNNQVDSYFVKFHAEYLFNDIVFAAHMLYDISVSELGITDKPMVRINFSKSYSEEEIVKLTGFEANYKKIEIPSK